MSHAEDTVQSIMDIALPDLIETLEKNQSKLSVDHVAALRNLLTDCARTALGLQTGRVAWPLSVGCGKTQSIVSFIYACNKLGLKDVSVMVAQEKVEALCDLKGYLLDKGVPEKEIGLGHSYKFNEAFAEEYRQTDKWPQPGYASRPSTPSYADRRFLLLTHTNVDGKREEQKSKQLKTGTPATPNTAELCLSIQSLLEAVG